MSIKKYDSMIYGGRFNGTAQPAAQRIDTPWAACYICFRLLKAPPAGPTTVRVVCATERR